MLLPALNKARATAKKVSCLSNVKQITMACIMYANDNDQRLPSGASESRTPNGVLDDSVPVLSGTIRTQMIHYAGTYKMLGCPSLGAPFNTETGYFEAGYGWVIGYNYLGGHTNTPWPLLPGGSMGGPTPGGGAATAGRSSKLNPDAATAVAAASAWSALSSLPFL